MTLCFHHSKGNCSSRWGLVVHLSMVLLLCTTCPHGVLIQIEHVLRLLRLNYQEDTYCASVLKNNDCSHHAACWHQNSKNLVQHLTMDTNSSRKDFTCKLCSIPCIWIAVIISLVFYSKLILSFKLIWKGSERQHVNYHVHMFAYVIAKKRFMTFWLAFLTFTVIDGSVSSAASFIIYNRLRNGLFPVGVAEQRDYKHS